MTGLYVQYGCGPNNAPSDWVNFDASPTLIFERMPVVGKLYTKNDRRFPPHVRYGDIVKGLPIAKNSADGLYASHVLNALPRDDCHRALANSYEMLKPKSGRFRLVVPDLLWRAKRYLSTPGPMAAEDFLKSMSFGVIGRERGFLPLLRSMFARSAAIWIWDEESMTAALRKAGFTDVRRCDYGDSDDAMFKLVEERGRIWCDELNLELMMEARK